jgi:DNA-binding GntR family transcriptional regulator
MSRVVVRKFDKPRTLVEEVAVHLREMILNGTISPGERLNELRLMQELSLSRSPLREAFRTLATEGLVTISPRRGARVRPISLEELRDVFEMRTLFETFALTRAARRMAGAKVDQMRGLLGEARMALTRRDVEAWYASSQQFHDAIVESAGNQQLKALYEFIKLSMRRYQLLVIGLPRHPDRSQVEHQRIFDALVRGNSRRASALLEAHIQRVAETLAAALARDARPDREDGRGRKEKAAR